MILHRFKIWQFHVQLHMLYLRSVREDDLNEEIEIFLSGVRYLALPADLGGVEIVQASEEDFALVRERTSRDPGGIYALRCGPRRHLVAGLSLNSTKRNIQYPEERPVAHFIHRPDLRALSIPVNAAPDQRLADAIAGREFGIWEYVATDAQLLLSSPRMDRLGVHTNVFILFLGVRFLELPAYLTGLEFNKPDAEDFAFVEERFGAVDASDTIFVLSGIYAHEPDESLRRRYIVVAARAEVCVPAWNIDEFRRLPRSSGVGNS